MQYNIIYKLYVAGICGNPAFSEMLGFLQLPRQFRKCLGHEPKKVEKHWFRADTMKLWRTIPGDCRLANGILLLLTF